MTDEPEAAWSPILPAELPTLGALVLRTNPWPVKGADPGTVRHDFQENMRKVYDGRRTELGEAVYQDQSATEGDRVAQQIKADTTHPVVLVHLAALAAQERYPKIENRLAQALAKRGIVVWLIGAKSATTGQATVYPPPESGKPYEVTINLPSHLEDPEPGRPGQEKGQQRRRHWPVRRRGRP